MPSFDIVSKVDSQTVEAYFPSKTYGTQTTPEAVIATIKAPWAHDARGTSVPTSLTIGAGDTVVLHVLHKNGDYLYPIVADPVAHWGWWGFMWWGSDWTIDHYSSIAEGISLVTSLASWPVAIAVAGTIPLWRRRKKISRSKKHF